MAGARSAADQPGRVLAMMPEILQMVLGRSASAAMSASSLLLSRKMPLPCETRWMVTPSVCAAARGERLPIAIVLGNHPAVLIAAALYLKLGDDEIGVAGALLGEPVSLLRCRTSSLLVPANAEIVIEGEIDAGDTVEEGPVSEYHGMYERYGAGHVVTLGAITRRRDAVLQVVEPGFHQEHLLIGGVAIAAGLYAHLAAIIPAVKSAS